MDSDSKSRRADARHNHDHLVATAAKMLALPNAHFSFNELARQAGVGIGTLYRHFPTKQTLLEVIYADKLAILSHKTFTGLPADQALEKWLQELVSFSLHSPGFEVLLQDALKEADSPLTTSGTKLLQAAQKARLLRTDVDMQELLGLINGIITTGVKKETTRINTMLSVVMAGLKK